ncbi:glycoside hydrolase family 72 and carbohydrate-binding module family 43 [Schizophyllum commune H4-8]|uniref:1,3-beta-glucanosyltransferase n=1 Tax=Schizophyllum commune (strain H4-8 / FGSC 9210) TaxID=578458 RepID=D8PNN5_SCHCM|nr:glycoside hydrolase family 72 and carbohydrate-binding module family 43 [Schizophyllum commune H4-8]KAI5898556.1 glycoside hydrolase family 72 and carbohydrate-binding module family 43 [Schizophyllum commune H4-8]
MRVTRAAAVLALAASVQAISKISRKGRYLYDDSGSRFYIKGVAYQEQGTVVQSSDNSFGEPSTFIDPLSSGSACKRDVSYLQDLGVNTIRVYSVNSSLDHDDCMKTFSDAGIYTIIDLSLPLNGSIDRASPSWSTNLLNQYLTTIDVFSGYDNVLAYNVGNEVVIGVNTTVAAPFIKGAARDVKAYLKSKSSDVLVGYAAIDGTPNWRDPLANYLTCDPNGKGSGDYAIDLYGLNNYEWCGDSTYEEAYAGTNGDYAGLSIPAYFSEFGCVESGQTRTWSEVEALYSDDMTDIWSGGLAFSYFPAESAAGQFGMVTVSDDGNSITTSDDFNNLKEQYNKVSPSNDPSSSSDNYINCFATNDTWLASNTLPPTPNEKQCECLESNLSCQFTPATANYSTVVGELLNYACSTLGSQGASCDDIGADGGTGTYGIVSGCDSTIKLSYVMSLFYEANDNNAQACSFNGNGTVNSQSTESAASGASACVSPSVFTPTAPANEPSSTGGSGSGGSSSSGSSGSDENAAADIWADKRAFAGMGVAVAVSMVSAVWTLL